jgi:hypothetical protein
MTTAIVLDENDRFILLSKFICKGIDLMDNTNTVISRCLFCERPFCISIARSARDIEYLMTCLSKIRKCEGLAGETVNPYYIELSLYSNIIEACLKLMIVFSN